MLIVTLLRMKRLRGTAAESAGWCWVLILPDHFFPFFFFLALASRRRRLKSAYFAFSASFVSVLRINRVRCGLCLAGTPQSPFPSGKASPEQRSFRDRQKYFEIDVKQQTPEKPKARVSLVGEDDLKKMREEEGWPSLLSLLFS